MPLSEPELTEFLESLELLLEGSPEGQNAALRTLLHRLEHFVDTEDTEPVETATGILGTAVGGQKGWQTPFRESGILSFTLSMLSNVNRTDALAKQCLRVIGNSVADNDTNRELAVQHLQQIIGYLASEGLRTTAFAVVFNLSNGFDPAKAAAATLRLDATISAYLALEKIAEAALDYATDLLAWTTSNLTAAQLKDATSLETFTNLLRTALRYDPDYYDEYVAILVHYLHDPEFQSKVATPKLLDDLVSLMLDFEARLTPAESEAVLNDLSIAKTEESTTSEETNVLLLTQLINSISAISATDAFAQTFNVTSQVVEKIRAKLRATQYSPSTVCACVMLGNLAMSDEVCIDMVNIMELHITLISILSAGTHSSVLYAAAGFTRHLTFPEANRSLLADAGLMRTCCRLLNLRDPSVRGEAAAMLCKLVTNNFHNIEKFVYEEEGDATILTRIVEQAIAPSAPLSSTAMKNPMVELGRTIVAMFRYLGRPNAEKDVDAVRDELLKVPILARPVARLIRQRFYADARSEGLLGLGLMAQSPEGAARIVEEINEDDGLLEAIKEFAEGKDEGAEQQGSAAGRDYQNAIVLLQALQNNAGNEMGATIKDQVIGLREELGKLLV